MLIVLVVLRRGRVVVRRAPRDDGAAVPVPEAHLCV